MAREMTRQEELFFAQKLAREPTLAAFLNNQVNAGQSFMQQAARLYVCDRCESGALAHGSGYACPHCGFRSNTRSTKVRDYMKGGFWR